MLSMLRLGAEPRLGERQVEADRVGRDLVAQGLELLGEPLGLLVADGRVERGDDVEEPGLAGRVGQRDHGQPRPHAREVGGLVARLQLGAGQVDRVALECHFAFARLRPWLLVHLVDRNRTSDAGSTS